MGTVSEFVLCGFERVEKKSLLELELKNGTTSDNLEDHIRKMAEGKLDGINLRIAINKKYSKSSKILINGDEVAFIPPVQGG